jgi:hypothetical protein
LNANSALRSSNISAPTSVEERPSAVSSPNNPRPGLEGLAQAVSDGEWDYLQRDDRYINYFAGLPIPKVGMQPALASLRTTRRFIRPAQVLAGCLNRYTEIFPDSQLLLVDTKPVIQFLFLMHAQAKADISKRGIIYLNDSPKQLKKFTEKIDEVRRNVLSALGVSPNESDEVLALDPSIARVSLGKSQDFVQICNERDLGTGGMNDSDPSLSYLQPYITIALANLLVAHGSSDEAVAVLAEWLDLWRCARGAPSPSAHLPGCQFAPILGAERLPEWFDYRAEFELAVILFRMVGEANITYRDFMRSLSDRFTRFVERPIQVVSSRGTDFSRAISLGKESEACAKPDPVGPAPSDRESADRNEVAVVRLALLRSLLGNENSLLRSEAYFLSDARVPELETLYRRGLRLATFTASCVDPRNENPDIWTPSASDYQITAGLLAAAVADRYEIVAVSADEHRRASEVRDTGARLMAEGYRVMKRYRDKDREAHLVSPRIDQIFSVSSWEESTRLAEQVLNRLHGLAR